LLAGIGVALALVGAIFLLIADVDGRLVLRPMEMPVGVMTALIGVHPNGNLFHWHPPMTTDDKHCSDPIIAQPIGINPATKLVILYLQ
jgi:hypothetical protein